MKELRIPVPSNNTVDLSAIDNNFKGIIIGYKGEQPVGFIQFSNGDWYFIVDIDAEGYANWDEQLLSLIECLIEKNICSCFKVIEFAKY